MPSDRPTLPPTSAVQYCNSCTQSSAPFGDAIPFCNVSEEYSGARSAKANSVLVIGLSKTRSERTPPVDQSQAVPELLESLSAASADAEVGAQLPGRLYFISIHGPHSTKMNVDIRCTSIDASQSTS